jgi:hypothetical protein
MNPRRQLDILTPVVRLRERRVEIARLEAVAARDALAVAEDALAARERVIATHDVGPGPARRLVRRRPFRLGRHGRDRPGPPADGGRRPGSDVDLRDQERAVVQLARENLDAALRELVRAQGRFEAMSGQRDRARSALLAQRDERQQRETEDLPARRATR